MLELFVAGHLFFVVAVGILTSSTSFRETGHVRVAFRKNARLCPHNLKLLA